MTDPLPAPAGITNTTGRPGIASAALFGLCPRCGERTLFGSLVALAGRCLACGLDFAAFDVGDRSAAFLTLIVGALVVALAITLDLTLRPPFWMHVLLWVPFTAGAVILGLRAGEAAVLVAGYRRGAGKAGLAADRAGDQP